MEFVKSLQLPNAPKLSGVTKSYLINGVVTPFTSDELEDDSDEALLAANARLREFAKNYELKQTPTSKMEQMQPELPAETGGQD